MGVYAALVSLKAAAHGMPADVAGAGATHPRTHRPLTVAHGIERPALALHRTTKRTNRPHYVSIFARIGKIVTYTQRNNKKNAQPFIVQS
ncbi:hypothetical protein Bamb_1570 [Burkholderia ambifaria AMMD]|uniref:Uncharacterized protein n=1 Tax=Burkholderia ambifaria (strain ATCC BAA-244 / DSM 16087 / CCUG 44356 / LMG 19182 / AMMD) TaxID=339670 RepID=Q0BFE5_BURCM|nr:hypothetical protein Bamb_1570 [Burkholderia ambifaria AMMD]